MVKLAIIESQHGQRTSIEFEPGRIKEMAKNSRIDAFIVSTEDGFSPLGANCAFLSRDLGIPEAEIRRLARWNRFENPLVSLIALQSRRTDSLLRGVILAAAGSSICYEQFAVHRYGRPYRDFYYNVTYESIAHLCEKWGARNLAISHLSGSGAFHEDIATCNAEALAQYCDSTPFANVESFMFLGCCISVEHFRGIARLNSEGTTGRHRAISTELQHREGFDLINLDWVRTAVNTRINV
jgi:hypothetical protein